MNTDRQHYIPREDCDFLDKHDFDRIAPFELDENALLKEIEELHQRADHFLQSMYNRSFTTKEFIDYANIGRTTALRYLRNRDDVAPNLLRKNGYVERWISHAEPPPSTEAGIMEIKRIENMSLDQIGRQAREDYEWTMSRGFKMRSPNARKR